MAKEPYDKMSLSLPNKLHDHAQKRKGKDFNSLSAYFAWLIRDDQKRRERKKVKDVV